MKKRALPKPEKTDYVIIDNDEVIFCLKKSENIVRYYPGRLLLMLLDVLGYTDVRAA